MELWADEDFEMSGEVKSKTLDWHGKSQEPAELRTGTCELQKDWQS